MKTKTKLYQTATLCISFCIGFSCLSQKAVAVVFALGFVVAALLADLEN